MSQKDQIIEAQARTIKTQAKLIKILEGERGQVCGFDETIKRFQANLRMLRAKKGISQIALGLQINVDNGYVSKLEAGKGQNPSLKIIHRFCRFYGCTFAEIMRK